MERRVVYIRWAELERIAEQLTAVGLINGIDHEGWIEFVVEGDDPFELGREVEELEFELRAYDGSTQVVNAGERHRPAAERVAATRRSRRKGRAEST
jgi:hypothetical protein